MCARSNDSQQFREPVTVYLQTLTQLRGETDITVHGHWDDDYGATHRTEAGGSNVEHGI